MTADTLATLLANPTLKPSEVCLVLRICREVAERGIKDGSIPSVRIASQYRIPSAWVREQLKLGLEATAA